MRGEVGGECSYYVWRVEGRKGFDVSFVVGVWGQYFLKLVSGILIGVSLVGRWDESFMQTRSIIREGLVLCCIWCFGFLYVKCGYGMRCLIIVDSGSLVGGLSGGQIVCQWFVRWVLCWLVVCLVDIELVRVFYCGECLFKLVVGNELKIIRYGFCFLMQLCLEI